MPSASSLPVWWRRWEGMPPSADRWQRSRSGWRRWFVGGWLWPPFALATFQVPLIALAAAGPDPDPVVLRLRAAQLLVCVLWALPIVVSRSKP